MIEAVNKTLSQLNTVNELFSVAKSDTSNELAKQSLFNQTLLNEVNQGDKITLSNPSYDDKQNVENKILSNSAGQTNQIFKLLGQKVDLFA